MTATIPKGFRAAGAAAGIRSGKGPDIALVVNDGPDNVAAVQLTTNRFCAAPVKLTRLHAENSRAKAVILNAGCANACTGKKGSDDALTMACETAAALGCRPKDILVCSTGMIGTYLPMEKVRAGITACVESLSADEAAADAASQAILTTDTHPKTVLWTSPDKQWSIGAMIKGAGMLAPGMATMLCVMTTDAAVEPSEFAAALAEAVDVTLNRVDSDGCMSTNDSVIALASGASGVSPSKEQLAKALTDVLADLSMQLICDAEGVNHTIAITVKDAATQEGAVAAARAISRSNLVKCAIFGNDPNWGRILSELGTVSADVLPFEADNVSVTINDVCIFAHGGVARPRDEVDMSSQHVRIDVSAGSGDASATVLSNDLSHDYVHENSAYSS
ncbi:MAG: bifunctional glutamate N-acetyltransferase/amino-acid acetyltransferase ArgJ [Actinomycetaceae bacterium]|nr:bifunctional glutamate N-acetyltransferase/amino-acid acetyltransferase ArgJ [Actinomycetaceae bacterium]